MTEGRYSEGICGDGAAILFDGSPIPIEQIVSSLNELERIKGDTVVLRDKLRRESRTLEACSMTDTDKYAYAAETLENVANAVDKIVGKREDKPSIPQSSKEEAIEALEEAGRMVDDGDGFDSGVVLDLISTGINYIQRESVGSHEPTHDEEDDFYLMKETFRWV